jgi:DNA-directed RNA polymerase subunit N (RpoN/RPB10)
LIRYVFVYEYLCDFLIKYTTISLCGKGFSQNKTFRFQLSDNELKELVAKCDRLQMKHSSLFRCVVECGTDVVDHFADVSKMVSLGSGSEREVDDIMLTRYACYLVAIGGDPICRQPVEDFKCTV